MCSYLGDPNSTFSAIVLDTAPWVLSRCLLAQELVCHVSEGS